MIPKPEACQGCPLYGSGKGFVPDEIPADAQVVVIGQNPGREEVTHGRPFVGPEGQALRQSVAKLGWRVGLGNALRCRLEGHCASPCNHLPSRAVLQQALRHCRTHLTLPPATHTLIAHGAVAWEALGQPGSISQWNGFRGPEPYEGRPVWATLHTGAGVAGRSGINRLLIAAAFERIRRGLDGHSQPIPDHGWIVLSDDAAPYMLYDMLKGASSIVLDTEFDPKTAELDAVGIRVPGLRSCILRGRAIEPAIQVLRHEAGRLHVLCHHAIVDLAMLARRGISPWAWADVDDTMVASAVQWSDVPHDLQTVAMLTTDLDAWKHLFAVNPDKYLHGDLVATETIWGELCGVRSNPAYLATKGVLPLYAEAAAVGIRIDRDQLAEVLDELERIQRDATVEAWAVAPGINLRSVAQVQDALKRYRVACPSLETDAVRRALQRDLPPPARVLLQARLRVMEAEGVRRYAAQLTGDRVYPSFTPTQRTGRISTADPPVANWPSPEKAARRGLPTLSRVLTPDPGEYWLGWDWSAMHARILAVEAQVRCDLEAFEYGWDLHVMNACQIWGWPPPPNRCRRDAPENAEWREAVGYDERKRHLAKTAYFAILNGLSAQSVLEAHEVVELGLRESELLHAAERLIAARPEMTRWKIALGERASRAGRVVSPVAGWSRMIVGEGRDRYKIAVASYLQGVESDILKLSLIRIHEVAPYVRLVMTRHDAGLLAVPEEQPWEQLQALLTPILEGPWPLESGAVRLPVEWHVTTYAHSLR